jgi:bacillolysin
MNRNILRSIALLFFVTNILFSFQIQNKFTTAKKYSGINISKLKNSKTVEKIQSTDFQNMIDIIKSVKSISGTSKKSGVDLSNCQSKVSARQLLNFQKLNENSNLSAKIHWHENNGTPMFIDRKSAKPVSLSKSNATLDTKKSLAKNFLNQYKDLLKLNNPDEELVLNKTDIEDNGTTHLKYLQYYKGIKVWGKDLFIHLDGSGYIESINGRHEPTPEEITDISYQVSSENALLKVKNDLGSSGKFFEQKDGEKVIYYDQQSKPHLAWFIEIRPDLQKDYYYFVDALSGEIIHKYDNTKYEGPTTGKGTDLLNQVRDLNIYRYGQTYYMFDLSKSMYDSAKSSIPYDISGGIVVLDAKNQEISPTTELSFASSTDSSQWPANYASLSFWGSTLYDFYKNEYNRNGLDDNGATAYYTANVSTGFCNAFWNGYGCYFGNGDSLQWKDMSRGLDIVGHEYGHGIVQNTANLLYEYQSGALNETYADWSGFMAENYFEGNNGDWTIGEDVSAVSGKCLRSLENPASDVVSMVQAKTMNEFKDVDITNDNGGVHYNSGITNRAFFLIAKEIGDGDEALGRERMGQVMYRALTKYLTQGSKFIDFRLAMIQSTTDLFPDQVSHVTAVFENVGISDGTATQPPDALSPVDSNDFILFVGNNDNLLYKAKSNIPINNSDISNVEYRVMINNKPSICENGSISCFVGTDQNIYLLDMERYTLHQVTTDAKWRSIAISPDANYIAAVPDPDSELQKIYIISTATGSIESRTLYSPTDGTGAQNFALFADMIDWSLDGNYLIYDCYNIQTLEGGVIKEFWDIDLMNSSDSVIIRVFPSPSSDVLLSNPTFSNTKPNVIAFDIFDYSDPDNPVYYVSTYDLFSGKMGLVKENTYLGYPDFSPDDSKIVFQTISSDGYSINLSQITLKEDGLNGDPTTVQLYIQNALAPVWYATGTRTDTINYINNPETTPVNYELYCNYPNPFNSSTVIKYYLPQQDFVKLEVYNLLGQKVETLSDGIQIMGYHSLVWNADKVGSGVYFCRLITPNFQKTIKILLSK